MGTHNKIEYQGYAAQIEWRPVFGEGMPSRQYHLIITQDDKIFIDHAGFTDLGAKTFFRRWVDKRLSSIQENI